MARFVRIYYSNGNMQGSTYKINNINEGNATIFHKNGNIETICNVVYGKYNGEFKQYRNYDKNILEFKCIFINDRINGEYYKYDSSGIITSKTNYLNDKKHGDETFYDKNGNITRIIKYIDDVQQK